MGNIWIREFLGGLDARRMPETAPGGVLIDAKNGHINRGGEFESRAAFVPVYDLPEGQTVGLAANRAGLVVFGSVDDPGVVPGGVLYQQLEPPGEETLIDVPSTDLYAGSIYAVGVFDDGSRHHFYDGEIVEDWVDGRARASFRVIGGVAGAAVAAMGSFEVVGGTLGTGNEITSIEIDGVEVLDGVVEHTGDNATTAQAIADSINQAISDPNYTAVADGTLVLVTAVVVGAAANGRAIVATTSGDASIGGTVALAGGADDVTSRLLSLRVDGVDIIHNPVDWTTSNEATAAAIADAINVDVSEPEYTAVASGSKVVILVSTVGEDGNGRVVSFQFENGFLVDPDSGLVTEGGVDVGNAFPPGEIVKTIGEKIYALAGPNMHFSGIRAPTGWTTDNVGAGFIDLSKQASGSEELTAIARYQQYAAVFSETVIQLWYVDPDPELYNIVQVLENTGTPSPRSVAQFGDIDVFYLNESGVRSLRARDMSNTASTNDIGVAIDPLVIAKLATLTDAERRKVFGLIEPRDGRFWLIMKDRIFVLSLYRAERTVSAWTYYDLDFDVDAAVVFNRKVYLRSGDRIFVYGGLGSEMIYDDTKAIARTPFLDADRPTQQKFFAGLDAALEGKWDVWLSMDVNDVAAQDKIAVLDRTTYNEQRVSDGAGSSTHFSLTFETEGVGPHKLGAVVLHYTMDESGKDEN